MLDMLNKLICVSLNIHIWSGRKKLQPADLKLNAGDIPPEELASLGVKKICDPDELKTFQNLRRRAERVCEAAGVRFLGGYAIPQDKAEDVVAELRKVAADFAEEKQHFLARYSESTEVWLKTIPSQWRHMVAEAIEPIESISSRLSFSHQTFQVQGVEGLDDGLTASVNSLGDRLIKEISRSAPGKRLSGDGPRSARRLYGRSGLFWRKPKDYRFWKAASFRLLPASRKN
jgi:hypothetical protein